MPRKCLCISVQMQAQDQGQLAFSAEHGIQSAGFAVSSLDTHPAVPFSTYVTLCLCLNLSKPRFLACKMGLFMIPPFSLSLMLDEKMLLSLILKKGLPKCSWWTLGW